MSVFSYFYFKNIRSSVYSSVSLYLIEMSNQSSGMIQSRIEKDLGILKSISALITAENRINTNKVRPILQSELKRNSFKRMGVIFPDGSSITKDGKFVNLKDRKFFQKALQGNANISDTITDKIDGKKINVYAVPIYKNTKVVAVLFATVNNDVFNKLLSISTFDGAGFSYVVKANGDVVIPPKHGGQFLHKNLFTDKHFLTEKISSQIKTDFNNRKGNMVYLDLDDQEYYLSYSPISYNDWYLLSVTPKSLVTKNFDKILKMAVYTTILILLLFLVLFAYISWIQNRYSKTLEEIVFVDEVTGGDTWIYFKKKATELISDTDQNYAFIIFDIDKFKIINDIFGWEQGDNVLKFLARKLKKSLKEGELAARVTNDNFAVLLKYEKEQDIVKRLAKFRKKISTYSMNPQTPIKLNVSCGVYRISEESALDFDVMHNKANFAKNLIKEMQNVSYIFYDDEMRNKIVWQNEIEREMNKALSKNQFNVYLQPKYSLHNSKIVGAEALVRWVHPDKGLIPPNDFIPLFEKNGFISKLDLYIFETVCKKLREWIDNGNPLVTVSVNISRVNFHNENLADILYKIASKYQIPVGFIEIEITETAVFENIENLLDIIKDLRMYGFPVSIDDFGSGYSSLNLLKDMEVDVLKLDREFFNLNTDFERSQKVVLSVISMAKDLHIKTVSEGVETIEHVDFLKQIGCDIAQGYYFAKPMPLADFEKLISLESGGIYTSVN